jgi:hypothetical protein
MLGNRALTETTTKLRLPADLLAELQRRGPRPNGDLHVPGWKPSFFNRLLDLLSGKRAR